MILYGEDRITPVQKAGPGRVGSRPVIRRIRWTSSFGNDAWRVAIQDLLYLQVGPYHTNMVAGLELAMDILRKRRNP